VTFWWEARPVALLGAASLALTASAQAQDKPENLTILSHRVHQTVATGSQGGDITEGWQKENGVGVEWVTMETGPLHERIFRELALPETSIDIAFLVNTRAVRGLTNLLEPLNAYQEEDPIEDFDDIFPGLVGAMTFDGELYGIPFRHASTCFHYNERMLEERGIERPQTMEEVIEAAYDLTYEAEDGTQVHGFVIMGDNYANIVDIARAWDGDFITLDYKLAVTASGMTKAAQTLRDFYEQGVLPTNWAAIKTEEVNTWLQTGRAAMTTTSCGRNRIYNDPEKSQEAGNIKTVALPVGEGFQDKFEVAPAKVEFWTMVIPANSQHKELAWSLVREMLSKESTLQAALNGNGPVRASTYDAPEIRDTLPYAEEERAVLKVGRVPLPAFDEAAKAGDIFVEEMQAAVLGMKPVEEALSHIESRVQPLLPQ
jgi:multiple sugar transport system substrate-binding protein